MPLIAETASTFGCPRHRATRPPRYGSKAAGRRPITESTYDSPFTVFLRRVPGWKIALIVAAVLAVVAGLVVVAGTLFLLILPVILVAGLAHRLFGGRRRGARGSPAGRDVIEGVFVAVSDERRETEPGAPAGKRRE